jgi:hypothetical protein
MDVSDVAVGEMGKGDAVQSHGDSSVPEATVYSEDLPDPSGFGVWDTIWLRHRHVAGAYLR